MREVYVCSGCGFVSTIATEYVRFGEETKSKTDKYYCTECALDKYREDSEHEATK